MNKIIVYSMRLAGNLMQRGFVLVGIAPNRANPSKHIFVFHDSELIRDAIEKYTVDRLK